MALKLSLVGGGRGVRTIASGTLSIGRGERNDWVLPDPDRHLSKSHCVIGLEAGRWVLTDLSSNGVHINGAREPTTRDSRVVLTDGDEFRIGEYSFVVEEMDARAAPASPLGPAEGADPLDIDPLDDPLGRAPDPSFSHPVHHYPAPTRMDDPFDRVDENRPRPRNPDDDLFSGVKPAVEWTGPTQADNVDANRHAMLVPKVLPPSMPSDIDFDALIGDLSDLAPPGRSSPGGPSHAAPPPRPPVDDPLGGFDDLLSPPVAPPSAPSRGRGAPTPAAPPAPAARDADPFGPGGLDPFTDQPPAARGPDPFAPPHTPAPPPRAPAPDGLGADPFADPSPRPAAPPPEPPRRAPPPPGGYDPFAEEPRPTAPAPVPAPSAVAPAPAPRAPAAAAGSPEALRQALAVLLEAAGVPDAPVGDDPDAALRTIGQVFRAMTEGLREVLMSRAAIKGELRVEQTLLKASNNNALKFSFSPEDAVAALLSVKRRGYMEPLAAAQEAFEDIKTHELAVMAGVQTALMSLLKRFDPDALESRLTQGKLAAVLPGARKARLWDSYRELYATVASEAEDDFQAVFGRSFAKAYKAQSEKD